ncbi:hypothetical protein RF55_25012, partial [Lasius niger]
QEEPQSKVLSERFNINPFEAPHARFEDEILDGEDEPPSPLYIYYQSTQNMGRSSPTPSEQTEIYGHSNETPQVLSPRQLSSDEEENLPLVYFTEEGKEQLQRVLQQTADKSRYEANSSQRGENSEEGELQRTNDHGKDVGYANSLLNWIYVNTDTQNDEPPAAIQFIDKLYNKLN